MYIFLKTLVENREQKVKDLLGEGQRWQWGWTCSAGWPWRSSSPGGVLYPPQPKQSGHLQRLLTKENYTHNLITTSLSVNIVLTVCVMQSIVTMIFRDVQTWKNPSMNTVIMSARTPDVPNSLTSILGRYNNSRVSHSEQIWYKKNIISMLIISFQWSMKRNIMIGGQPWLQKQILWSR